MIYFYFLFAVINLTSAAVFIKEPCPDVKAKENFQLDKYGQGRWYEVARYPNDIEKQGDCPVTDGVYENGRSKFRTTEIIDGEKVTISGYYVFAPNAGMTGILNIQSANTSEDAVDHTFPVHIIETDYDNYAVAYDCRYNEAIKTRHDYVWIIGRTRKFDDDIKAKIDDIISSTSYIDSKKLIWLHQTDEFCATKHEK